MFYTCQVYDRIAALQPWSWLGVLVTWSLLSECGLATPSRYRNVSPSVVELLLECCKAAEGIFDGRRDRASRLPPPSDSMIVPESLRGSSYNHRHCRVYRFANILNAIDIAQHLFSVYLSVLGVSPKRRLVY